MKVSYLLIVLTLVLSSCGLKNTICTSETSVYKSNVIGIWKTNNLTQNLIFEIYKTKERKNLCYTIWKLDDKGLKRSSIRDLPLETTKIGNDYYFEIRFNNRKVWAMKYDIKESNFMNITPLDESFISEKMKESKSGNRRTIIESNQTNKELLGNQINCSLLARPNYNKTDEEEAAEYLLGSHFNVMKVIVPIVILSENSSELKKNPETYIFDDKWRNEIPTKPYNRQCKGMYQNRNMNYKDENVKYHLIVFDCSGNKISNKK